MPPADQSTKIERELSASRGDLPGLGSSVRQHKFGFCGFIAEVVCQISYFQVGREAQSIPTIPQANGMFDPPLVCHQHCAPITQTITDRHDAGAMRCKLVGGRMPFMMPWPFFAVELPMAVAWALSALRIIFASATNAA